MPALQLDQLDPESNSMVSETVAILDAWWDEAAGLIRETSDVKSLPTLNELHVVRESNIYYLGLFMCNRDGDQARANRMLKVVLENQFNEPDRPYHGTFYRYPEEPRPPECSLIWRDYDPIGYLPNGVGLSAYGGKSSNLPGEIFQGYLDKIEAGTLKFAGPKVYNFTQDEVRQGHGDMENNLVFGKLVVKIV